MNCISIVIPIYNEKENILIVLEKIIKSLKKIKFEILIVDDHSNDGTFESYLKVFKNEKRIKYIIRKVKKRDLSKSNFFDLIDSTLPQKTSTFLSSIADDISLTTFTFLAIESANKNFTSGKKIASGIPGNPPPVPRSITSMPETKGKVAAIDNECKTCFK